MSDGIMITIGDDGEATLYDDTYDITIHCESKEEQDEVRKALENIPHWIPVAERLPKPRESVIISVNGKYGDWIGEGCYWETTENHVIWKGYRWNATYWDDEIIAWMPLPDPYKGVTT